MSDIADDDVRLETPKQLAARVGISERQVRYLIDAGELEFVRIGCRVHVPIKAFPRFLAKKVTSWQDETRDHASAGSTDASASMSCGQSMAAAASAQRARRAANKLKRSSQTGCRTKDDAQAPAQVIRLRSS